MRGSTRHTRSVRRLVCQGIPPLRRRKYFPGIRSPRRASNEVRSDLLTDLVRFCGQKALPVASRHVIASRAAKRRSGGSAAVVASSTWAKSSDRGEFESTIDLRCPLLSRQRCGKISDVSLYDAAIQKSLMQRFLPLYLAHFDPGSLKSTSPRIEPLKMFVRRDLRHADTVDI